MIKRITLVLPAMLSITWGIKTEDPRSMDFPLRIDFSPREVQRTTLSNGIEVFLVEDHELPLIDVIFSVRAGESRVPFEEAGLADLLVDLIVEGGSKEVSNQRFHDSLANFGATFEASYGGVRYSEFNLHMLAEHTGALLPLVFDAILHPALPQEKLEISKGRYLTAYQGRNTEPSSVAWRIYSKLLYGNNSPMSREVTPRVLENISVDKLKGFHNLNYRPDLTMIGMVGDFDSEEMVDLLEELLGDWRETVEEPTPELDIITNTADPGVYYVHWPGAVQTNIRMGYLSFLRDDPRYPGALLFSEIYGASRFSRMRLVVREKHGLSYSPYGWVSAGLSIPGSFGTSVLTKSESTNEAVRLVFKIIDELRTDGITDEDLMLAKSSWLASFPEHYSEAEDVLHDRMLYARYGYPLDFWDRLPDKVEPLTREDVNDFAAGFLEPEKLIILVLGDSTGFERFISELGKVTVIDPEEY